MTRLYVERGLSRNRKPSVFWEVLKLLPIIIAVAFVAATIFFFTVMHHPQIAMAAGVVKGGVLYTPVEFCKQLRGV